MPPRAWRDRLADVLAYIDKVQSYIAGMTYDEFVANEVINEAVRYCIGIIGEAARNVPEDIVNRYPNVPWRQAIRMRNFLAHVYWATDDTILWDTATHDLAPLRAQIEAVLAENPETEQGRS